MIPTITIAGPRNLVAIVRSALQDRGINVLACPQEATEPERSASLLAAFEAPGDPPAVVELRTECFEPTEEVEAGQLGLFGGGG